MLFQLSIPQDASVLHYVYASNAQLAVLKKEVNKLFIYFTIHSSVYSALHRFLGTIILSS